MATETRELRRFTVEEYHAMGRAGILHEDDRVELIDGKIFTMTPVGSWHFSRVNALNQLFVQRFAPNAVVSVQNPILLGEYGEPEPDLVLLHPRDDYAERLPEPEDVHLVVEVADTTLERDREKMRVYAEHGVPEAWIIPAQEDCLEAYRRPSEDGYGTIHRLRRGEQVAPLAFPEVALEVDELLG